MAIEIDSHSSSLASPLPALISRFVEYASNHLLMNKTATTTRNALPLRCVSLSVRWPYQQVSLHYFCCCCCLQQTSLLLFMLAFSEAVQHVKPVERESESGRESDSAQATASAAIICQESARQLSARTSESGCKFTLRPYQCIERHIDDYTHR